MARDLAFGMIGEDVRAVQRLLNYHLAPPLFMPLDTDGKFGPKTRARVVEFQTLNQMYLVYMPIEPAAGVERKPLKIDGIIGPNTGRVLLDVREVTFDPDTTFTPYAIEMSDRLSFSPSPSLGLQLVGDPPAPPPAPSPPPSPPAKVITFVSLEAGAQAQANPWLLSPFVLTGQFTMLARNQGKSDFDFLLTAGGQFAANVGNANGWSAQVFGQMGLGNLGLSLGPVDFLNPFVQAMLVGNQSQPGQVGFAAGNQINVSLGRKVNINGIEQDTFFLFANLQELVSVGLDNGQCSAPATQGLIGLGWNFGWSPPPSN